VRRASLSAQKTKSDQHHRVLHRQQRVKDASVEITEARRIEMRIGIRGD
jgi:hypothetical protein